MKLSCHPWKLVLSYLASLPMLLTPIRKPYRDVAKGRACKLYWIKQCRGETLSWPQRSPRLDTILKSGMVLDSIGQNAKAIRSVLLTSWRTDLDEGVAKLYRTYVIPRRCPVMPSAGQQHPDRPLWKGCREPVPSTDISPRRFAVNSLHKILFHDHVESTGYISLLTLLGMDATTTSSPVNQPKNNCFLYWVFIRYSMGWCDFQTALFWALSFYQFNVPWIRSTTFSRQTFCWHFLLWPTPLCKVP